MHADADDPPSDLVRDFSANRRTRLSAAVARAHLPADDRFGILLTEALQAFIVRRGPGHTVIAGYPWFLDWGRDTFIAARGMLSAGLDDEVQGLLTAFGRFLEYGTMPNVLNGDDASNRDTSDAPLWYALATEEWVERNPDPGWRLEVSPGRTLRDALTSIATGWIDGTPNGIRVDPTSGLAWSPPHFTWMDTNFPACTPRTGYPVEIQALWIRLLRQLVRCGAPMTRGPWDTWAARAEVSFERFWLPKHGWLADVLLADGVKPAAEAIADHCLRPNMLFAVSLGIVTGTRARACVAAARRWLLVPGALRSLAPLPMDPPLNIRDSSGRELADPHRPYAGHYVGDEDTRRKPAYHNGTAWIWLLPTYCEAMLRAWNGSPAAHATAKADLGSVSDLLEAGCLGQLPELCDGDAPHRQRGCDAQAWSVSEALRVWRILNPCMDKLNIP